MKVKILKRKDGGFQGNDGENVIYYWYDAVRISDDMLIQFGSREGGHEEGSEKDLNIVKYERKDGKTGYKEINED